MNLDNLFNDYSALLGIVSGISFLIGLVLQYFYLKNLSDLLKAIRGPNRKMPPGQVWLLLLSLINYVLTFLLFALTDYDQTKVWIYTIVSYSISIFTVIWQFRIVYKIADSIEAEYDSRKIPIEHRPSFQTGLCMAGGNAVALLKNLPAVGFVGAVGGFVALIGWIAYWVRTYKFKKEIQAMPEYIEEGESLIFSDL